MYVKARVPLSFRSRPQHSRHGYKTLGDTCWIDARSGAQVCGSGTGDPTGEMSCTVTGPYNKPAGSYRATPTESWMFSLSGNTLTGIPPNKHQRIFSFMYHAGYLDVYQLVSGGTCPNFPCLFATVDQSGAVALVAAAPAKNETGCQNITTAVTTSTGVQTVTATPVQTYTPSNYQTQIVPGGSSSSPYVSTAATSKGAAKSSSFSLSSIPVWALVGGAGVGGLLISKMLGKR